MSDDPLLLAALSVTDGTPVDWAAFEHRLTDEDRRFLKRLQQLEAVGRLHSSGVADGGQVHESIRAGVDVDAGVPLRWGSLEIVEKIGRGSYGDVYRARDPRLGRDVALKLLRHRDARPDSDSTLIHEAHLLSRVRHPNVVTVYGAERIDGRTGLWMEFVEGETLEDELRRRGPLPPHEVARLGVDLASALQAVHAAGLLHRDVKAQNVMRDAQGRVVLMDFGAGDEHDARGEGLAGTPAYLAPEVLDGAAASQRSDVYALGVLLFRLLTGALPIAGATLAQVRETHRQRRIASVVDRRPDAPRALAAAIDRALARDPSARFATIDELRAALATAAAPRRRRRTGLAVAAAALLATAAVAVVATRSDLLEKLLPAALWKRSARAEYATAQSLVQVATGFGPRIFLGGPSPDGRTVVCSDGDKRRLAFCDIEQNTIHPLDIPVTAGEPDGSFALLSADGRSIVYPRAFSNGSALHVVNADGTGDRALYTPAEGEKFLRPGGWTSDGRYVVADLMRFDRSHQLEIVDVSDGRRRVIRRFSADEPVQMLTISPDGRYVAYDLPDPVTGDRDIVITDVATSASSTLLDGPADDLGPLWSPDGNFFVFTSDRNGTFGVWRQAVTEGGAAAEPQLVTDSGRDPLLAKGFTDGGRTVLFKRYTGAPDVFRAAFDASGAPMTPSRVSRQLLDQNASADWSPDGKRIAYLAARTRWGASPRTSRIVIKDAVSGTERDFPLDATFQYAALRWWPDGHSLLMRHSSAASPTLRLERVDAQTGERLGEIKAFGGLIDPIVTPDAMAALYLTPQEIRERNLASGAERTVLRSTATMRISGPGLMVSPDGEWVAFRASPGGTTDSTVHRVSRVSGAVEPLPVPADVDGLPIWLPGDSSMLFLRKAASGARRALVLVSPSGEVKQLGLFADGLRQVRVSPDGREILFTAGNLRAESWLVRNLR